MQKKSTQHPDLEDVMFISKYGLGMQQVDTTDLYRRVVLSHRPWRTAQHAAELVGNYGQAMTFNSPIYTVEQKQKKPNLSGYTPPPEMLKEMREMLESVPFQSIKRVKK